MRAMPVAALLAAMLLVVSTEARSDPFAIIATYTGTGAVLGPENRPLEGPTTYTALPPKCTSGASCKGWIVTATSLEPRPTATVQLKTVKGGMYNAVPMPILDLTAANVGFSIPADAPSTLVATRVTLKAALSNGDLVTATVPLTFHWVPSSRSGSAANYAEDLALLVRTPTLVLKSERGQRYSLRIDGLGVRPAKGAAYKPTPPTVMGTDRQWRAYVKAGTSAQLSVWATLLPAPLALPTAAASPSPKPQAAAGH